MECNRYREGMGAEKQNRGVLPHHDRRKKSSSPNDEDDFQGVRMGGSVRVRLSVSRQAPEPRRR